MTIKTSIALWERDLKVFYARPVYAGWAITFF